MTIKYLQRSNNVSEMDISVIYQISFGPRFIHSPKGFFYPQLFSFPSPERIISPAFLSPKRIFEA
jgi:hypothetical protein